MSVSLIASTVPIAPTAPQAIAFHEVWDGVVDAALSIDLTWEFLQNFRATGGVPVEGWRIFTSPIPIADTFANWTNFTAALTGGGTALGATNLPCTRWNYIWVQVAAYNAIGTGLLSDRVRFYCSRNPGDIPPVTRAGGTDNSITVEFGQLDALFYRYTAPLYTSPLVGYKLAWLRESVIVGPDSRRYTLENLIPGYPYNFTVQAITESGTGPILYEEILYAGGSVEMDAPMFYESDGETITLAWPALNDTLSSPLVAYEIYISADNRTIPWFNLSQTIPNQTWPLISTPEHPELTPMATYVHNCSGTKLQVHKGSIENPVDQGYGAYITLENRERDYIYARVAARTAATLGELSPVVKLFCAPRPDAPKLFIAGTTEDTVMLAWNTTDLYGAPVVAYNVYADDGLGGDIKLLQRIEGRNATLYDPLNNYSWPDSYDFITEAVEDSNATISGASVLLDPEPFRSRVFGWPVTGLEFKRLYRLQVTVVSAAAESKRSEIRLAQVCRTHATAPYIEYESPCVLPLGSNSTECSVAVTIRWHPFNPGPYDCPVYGYAILAEHETFIIEYIHINGTASPVLVSDWNPFDIWNETYGNLTGADTLISPTFLSYRATGLIGGETYRFKVRTVTLSGHTDSRWAVATPP
jgi:hypothetical protein